MIKEFLVKMDDKTSNTLAGDWLFQTHMKKVSTEKDVEFPELTLNDLKEVKTKDNYITLMKYFIKQPE